MNNRLGNLFNFKRSQDAPLTLEQRKNIAQAEDDRRKGIEKNIVDMAVALNTMINPGVSVVVDIQAGAIVVPGRPQGNAIIIFSKPAAMQTLRAQLTADPGNGKGEKNVSRET